MTSVRRTARISALTGLAILAIAAAHGGGLPVLPHRPLIVNGWNTAARVEIVAGWCAFGLVLLAVLVSLLDRRRRGASKLAPLGSLGGWWTRLAAMLVALCFLLAPVGFLLVYRHHVKRVPAPLPPPATPARAEPQPHRAGHHVTSGIHTYWIVLIILVVALFLLSLARDRPQLPMDESSDRDPPDDSVADVREAIEAARESLAIPVSDREAVILAYIAMHQVITGVDLNEGSTTITPRRLVAHVARFEHVDPQLAETVAAIFEKARFSGHPVTPTDRRDVEEALAQLAVDVTVPA